MYRIVVKDACFISVLAETLVSYYTCGWSSQCMARNCSLLTSSSICNTHIIHFNITNQLSNHLQHYLYQKEPSLFDQCPADTTSSNSSSPSLTCWSHLCTLSLASCDWVAASHTKMFVHRKTRYGEKPHKPTVFGCYVDLAGFVLSE